VKFSLLVVTTDRLHLAERLFRSLAAQSHKDFEVLFVHGQACAEEAVALARKYDDALDVRPVPSPTPALSRARNLALPLLNGDCIAFPDDDCVYCPDTLERAVALFTAHPEADVLLAAGKDLLESGDLPTVRKDLREDDLPAAGEGRREKDRHPAGSGEAALRAVNRYSAFRRSGTIVQFYRRRCVETVGPFDEKLGPGTGLPYGCGEDTDYVLRALAAGFAVYRAPEVVVRHAPMNIREAGIGAKIEAYARGRMYLLRKHGLPAWFVAANIAWPLFCVPGECLRECRAVVRFRWDMFRARLSSCLGAAG
jgi:glycosyltransferase involved in cell wall biosynthesis